MPIKVAINGYGTIGKRIASAILRLPDFELVGVAKYSVDYSAFIASRLGIKMFVPREKYREFRERGVEPEGDVEYLINEADLIYDASPPKQGLKNKEVYTKYNKPAIFQGGEPPNIAETSYSTLCNYQSALGKKYIRVVSCNTTGILRVLCSIGIDKISSIFGVIIRRASDPKEDQRGPVNSVTLDMQAIPSHHAIDVKMVIGDVPISTVAVIAPTTLMHVHVLNIKLRNKNTQINDLLSQLESSNRILLLDALLHKIDSTGKIVELARDFGRPRYDIYENIVFLNATGIDLDGLILTQAIHQEAIVIPENVDAAYAIMNVETDPIKVVEKTNRALKIGELKILITKRGNK